MEDKEVADEMKMKNKKQSYWNSYYFLGRDAPQSFTSVQIFRRNVLPPSSGSKNRSSKHAVIKNVCGILPDYMTSHTRR
jgi:hypothetical protein